MTLLEALKVAQEACRHEANFYTNIVPTGGLVRPALEKGMQLREAAAVLARLESEWPKLKAAVDVVADMLDSRVDDLLAAFSRLDAAPKEGS